MRLPHSHSFLIIIVFASLPDLLALCFKERSSHTMPGINYAQESSNRPRLVKAVFPIANPVEVFKIDVTRSLRCHHLSPTSDSDELTIPEDETKGEQSDGDLGSRGRVLVMRHYADPNAGTKMPVPVFVECRMVTH